MHKDSYELKQYCYRAYGLSIHSEIELPELISDTEINPDVWIKKGPVPQHLPNITGSGALYEASPNDFLLRLDAVAKYRVQDGKYITIESNELATPREIRLFLLGSSIGALLHQRGILSLHGTTVAKANKGYIIIGVSSSGKSTLAAGLQEKGYSLITEDISAIGFLNNNRQIVYPGVQHLKLWKDVLLHLNGNINLEKIRPQLEKYIKPTTTSKPPEPVILNKIISLSTKNTPGYHFREVFGVNKFNLLRKNTYRIQFMEKMNQSVIHFNNISRLAQENRLFIVERPSSPLQVMALTEFIINNILDL